MIKPLNDNIAIKVAKRKDRTESGLFIPETSNENSMCGEVVAVGPGRITDQNMVIKPMVKVGDTVWYRKFDTIPVDYNGEEILFIREVSILGIEPVDQKQVIKQMVMKS